MLVIDASAAVQASLPSDGFALLDREELVAPALLWSEVPSVLHEMAERGASLGLRSTTQHHVDTVEHELKLRRR